MGGVAVELEQGDAQLRTVKLSGGSYCCEIALRVDGEACTEEVFVGKHRHTFPFRVLPLESLCSFA